MAPQQSVNGPRMIPVGDIVPLSLEDILDDDVIVRQSIANSMKLCPASVGYSSTEGYIDVFGEAAVFGSTTHKFCEVHIINPQGQADRIKPSAFNEIVDDVLEENYNSSRADISASDYKLFRRKVIEAYRLWVLQCYEPELKSAKDPVTEFAMWVHLGHAPDGRRIILHGTADLVLPSVRIEDFKTTNGAFKWTQQKADTEIQPTYYLAMWNIITGQHLTDWRYRIYDRKKEDWNSLDTERSLEAQEAGLRGAYQYGLQLAARAFPPTPITEVYGKPQRGWYCSAKWCGAWNVCEYKALPDDQVNLEELAVKHWS